MTAQELSKRLLALPDAAARLAFLQEQLPALGDQRGVVLKDTALQLLRTDTHAALQVAEFLVHGAESSGTHRDKGYGLWALAVVRSLGLSHFQQALEHYDQALHIFRQADDTLSQATIEISRVWSLASLGRHTDAFAAAEWAGGVLEQHKRWLPLSTLKMNLAIIHSRLGDDATALAALGTAQKSYERLGVEGKLWWAQAEHNRAIALRNLGRFAESIAASQMAQSVQARLGNTIEAARAQQALGVTYFVQGRYNQALLLLEQARDTFIADGSQRHAVRAELYICDCLLYLRRFADVVEASHKIRALFQELQTPLEEAQAALNEAIAWLGLVQYDKALAALDAARALFASENSQIWVAHADLERAIVLYEQTDYANSMATAQACAVLFAQHDLPIKEAEAYVVAARAALSCGLHERVRTLVLSALEIGESKDIPWLVLQARHLAGRLARTHNDIARAKVEFEQAIHAHERLRGAMMIEHRIGFQTDKDVLYADMVDLCLQINEPLHALDYVEQAKSRALLELLTYRLDLSLRAKDNQDFALVEKLTTLRRQRDQLYRRWLGDEESRERGLGPTSENTAVRQQVQVLDRQMAQLWRTLLVRRADEYTQDIALAQVHTEPIQQLLEEGTLLLEYFAIHDQFVVFLVTADAIEVQRLPCDVSQIKQLQSRLLRNLRIIPNSTARQMLDLTVKAGLLLQQMYANLIAPCATVVNRYRQLTIVPHGPLHYLPFHAFHSGDNFLLETHEISYLPNGSLLAHRQATPVKDPRLEAFAFSHGGHLPYAIQEAEAIAQLFPGQAHLDSAATLAQLQNSASACDILHLATHAEFRAEEPLFSGISLADGWLTTLDIFGLTLHASLVTLSACQTGRSVVSGGDELLGLMRAFLYAGARSLLMSLWSVEDRSTSRLMESFYTNLASGMTQRAALRQAQLAFVQGRVRADGDADTYQHPYFWAPFFLVGHCDEPFLAHGVRSFAT